MDPLILFSILLSVVLGVLRGADLAWGTDPVTGLCVVGSVWWRYLLLAAVVLAAVLAGRSRGKDPATLCTRKPGGAAAAFAAAVCFLVAAAVRLLFPAGFADLVRIPLGVLCACWLSALGSRWLTAKEWKAPAGGILLAVAGSVLFYWNLLMRFMENSSSWHRVTQTAMVWQMLAALLLLSALARALYLPKPENGSTLCAAGLAAFGLCLCWELPRVVQLALAVTADGTLLPELLSALGLCAVGALGGICAAGCAKPRA